MRNYTKGNITIKTYKITSKNINVFINKLSGIMDVSSKLITLVKENNLCEFQAWNQTSQELITVARVNYFNINSILAANLN